jgi:ureidoglycolate lyase
MFSCFPRNISGVGMQPSTDREGDGDGDGETKKVLFTVSILERHPYTTQTFSPLGLSAHEHTAFLVVVAPSLSAPASATTAETSAGGTTTVQIASPPDLSRIRAFVARGDQAVTYGPGTWHAPMAVVGRRRVDFVVTQFVDGVPDHDCQEVLLGENAVRVDLTSLDVDLGLSTDRVRANL